MKVIKTLLGLDENGNTTHPNRWDTIQVSLKGKFISLSVYIRKLESSRANSTVSYLKILKQQEEILPEKSRGQEPNSGLKSMK